MPTMKLEHKLILLAIELDDAASEIRASDGREDSKRADELVATAQMLRQWIKEMDQ